MLHPQAEIHTAKPLVLEPSALEVEIAVEKVRRHKLVKFQQNLLKQEVGQFILSPIYLPNFIWNKEELPEQWKGSLIVPGYKKSFKTGFSKYRYISLFCMGVKLGVSH